MGEAGKRLIVEPTGAPRISGFVHEPAGASSGCLMLTHGAGGNCQAPLLVVLAETLSGAGITVLRFDLPFRQRRPHGPPSPAAAAQDQDGIRSAARLMRETCGGLLYAGGQSYGGRQTSHVAAGDNGIFDGLVLLSYPLHPPGHPTRLRTEHFGRMAVPSLFVSGDRDPFGSIDELHAAMALIPAKTHLLAVAGAGHSLLTKANRPTAVPAIEQAVLGFVRRVTSPP